MKDYWTANFDITKFIATVKTLLVDPTFLPLILPGLFLIPFINRAKLPYASLALLSIGVLSMCVVSILLFKLPMRVLVCIITPLTLFGIRYISMSKVADAFQRNVATKAAPLAMAPSTTSKGTRSIVYSVLLLSAIVPTMLLVSQLQERAKTMAELEIKLGEAVQHLSPQADQLYFCWPTNLRVIVSPFTDLSKIYRNMKIVPIGAIGQAPFVWKRLETFGITNPLGQLDKENVFIISNSEYNRFIRMYAAEKLGKEVVFTPVPVKSKILTVYKAKYVTPADPEKLKRDLSVAFLTEK